MVFNYAFIKKTFDHFNGLCFNNQLPYPLFELSKAKSFLGQFSCRKEELPDGTIIPYSYRMRFSTYRDLPEEELEDVILHEMIHYFITWKRLQDTSTHGQLFQQIMQDINQKYNRHIVISRKDRETDVTSVPKLQPRLCVVALISMTKGRTAIKVLPRTFETIFNFTSTVKQSPEINDIQLFLTSHPFFSAFPKSGALKVHIVDRAKVVEALADALKMTYNETTDEFDLSQEIGFKN